MFAPIRRRARLHRGGVTPGELKRKGKELRHVNRNPGAHKRKSRIPAAPPIQAVKAAVKRVAPRVNESMAKLANKLNHKAASGKLDKHDLNSVVEKIARIRARPAVQGLIHKSGEAAKILAVPALLALLFSKLSPQTRHSIEHELISFAHDIKSGTASRFATTLDTLGGLWSALKQSPAFIAEVANIFLHAYSLP